MRDEILTLLGLTHVPKARTQSPHYLQQLEELRSKKNHTVRSKSYTRWQYHQHSTSSFYVRKSQKCKKTLKLWVFFMHSESAHKKAARRTLMKLTPRLEGNSYERNLVLNSWALRYEHIFYQWQLEFIFALVYIGTLKMFKSRIHFSLLMIYCIVFRFPCSWRTSTGL